MTREDASIAKITRPKITGIFPRKRLFRLLDGARRYPVTFVSAPAGSGKTTLVTSYLDARNLACLWYQVDEGDADIASFFYYLGMAARKAAPLKKKPLPLLTPEYLQGIPTFSRRYFENLYSRLIPSTRHRPSVSLKRVDAGPRPKRAAVKKRFLIVFDDYQEVPDGSPFHEVLREGFSQVPEGMNILLISRRELPDAFVRLRANRSLGIIGWKELKFTLGESKRMFRLRGYKRIPVRVLRQLHKKTDGWAAGIVLLMNGMKDRGGLSVLPEKGASKEIFSYFAREIFDKAEPGIRDFLLKTSFFPQMSSEMAESLTANPQTQRILSDLVLKNYFIHRHESQDVLYQYHLFFREFLQALAGEAFDSKDLFQIKKDAALILEANGRTEDAIDILTKLGDWPDAAGLILKHAPELVGQGRGQTLEKWIKSLPESMFEEEPWLLYWAGVYRLPFAPSESHGIFDKALGLFRQSRNAVGTYLSLSGLLDSTTYGFGSFKPLDHTIVLVDQVSQEFQSFPSLEVEARLTASMLHAMALRQPHHPDFEKRAERALSLLQHTADINTKVQILLALIINRLFSGELSKAESLLESFRILARSPGVTSFLLVSLKDMEAFYYWLTAALEENQKAVTEGLRLASTTGVHLIDAHLSGQGAAGALSVGDIQTGNAFINRMASHSDRMSLWAKAFCDTLSMWASLIQGDLSKALYQAESCLRSSVESGMPQTETFTHIGYALVLHELKRGREALYHLAKALRLARLFKVPLGEFMCFLAEAQLALEKGDEVSGLRSLKKALSIGREKGYANTYYFGPPVIANLCKRALEAGIEVKYVQGLIRKRNLVPDLPPYECEHWPWPLKLNTFGRFVLMKDGKALQSSGKGQKKPLLFLKAMITLGGKDIKEDRISDLLWPEADGDQAHSAFKTTLSRLRRLIGHEEAIEYREGKATLHPHHCWVDTWAFEGIYEKVDKQFKHIHEKVNGKQEEIEKIMLSIEKAVNLYKGHFLADETEEIWTTSYREALRCKFAHMVTRLGNYLQETGQWDKAVQHYQKALEIDDLAEEFYQHLMVCHRVLGQNVKAVDVYKRCKQMLTAFASMGPSPETEAIYRGLT